MRILVHRGSTIDAELTTYRTFVIVRESDGFMVRTSSGKLIGRGFATLAEAKGEVDKLLTSGRDISYDAYATEAYRGFLITESIGDGFIIHKGGVRYGSKPTIEAAKREVDLYVAQGLGQDSRGARDHWTIHSRVRGYQILEGAGVNGGEWAVRYPDGTLVEVSSVSEAREQIHLETEDAAGDVRIVYNKLLGGWYIVRGSSDTPISGRFGSKEEAQAHLERQRAARDAELSFKVEPVDRGGRTAYQAVVKEGGTTIATTRLRGTEEEAREDGAMRAEMERLKRKGRDAAQGHTGSEEWQEEMVKRVMQNVRYAMEQGKSLEEAIAYAKERSTAGPKVWEIVRQRGGR